MELVSLEKAELEKVVAVLKKGGLVVSPSDTVYGLLADATSEKAVQKLALFKNRPPGKPVSIFVSDFGLLQQQVEVKKQQYQLLRKLMPGPFTVILPSRHLVSSLLESEKGTLGVRIPDYPFIIQLVKKFGKPVTATSANLSGQPPHYSIRSLLKILPGKKRELVDLFIDGGMLPRNKPSTVIDLTTPRLKVVRQGDIIFKDKETYISRSPDQTKKIAKYIFKKVIVGAQSMQKPLIFIIKGQLGVGKTIFVKGIGEFLGITNIISPTFVIYYEYSVSTHPKGVFLTNKLVHIDLYNIQDSEEFKYLGLENYLIHGNLLCVEWGEKAGEIMDLLKRKGKIVYVRMKYSDEKTREIIVNF